MLRQAESKQAATIRGHQGAAGEKGSRLFEFETPQELKEEEAGRDVRVRTAAKAAGDGGSEPSSELPLTYPREALHMAQHDPSNHIIIPSTITQS